MSYDTWKLASDPLLPEAPEPPEDDDEEELDP